MTTRYGFVSTYPPTLCGLATFTSALQADLVTAVDSGLVIRSVDTPQPPVADVAAQLVGGDPRSRQRAASLLNECDIVIVQHEYGTYGGADGDELLTVLDALTVPTIGVLHTVLSEPTPHQREVLNAVTATTDAVVVMTETAHDRLAAGYSTDMRKVSVIPHGAPPQRISHAPAFRSGQPTVLTWGLMGPGKGIEWGIEAMAALTDLVPAPRYVVAGQTHPKVVLHEGEAYRNRLGRLVRDLNLTNIVSFDGHYRHPAALAELVNSADIILLPYDSTDQVTSGVLIEAVAAGKPVVATRFPHAVELLGGGGGTLVAHKNPAAIAAALRNLLTHHDVAARMTGISRVSAPELQWAAVAARYRSLAARLIGARVAA